MKITPLDIQQQQFTKKRGRYDAGEVDSFLEMVRIELEEILRENAGLKDELKRVKNRLSELVEHEKTLKDAIISTQRASDDIKAHAHKQAEIIVAEAHLDGEKLVGNAHEQVRRLANDVQELKRQRARLEAELSAILNAHLKLLEANNEEAGRNSTEADKVALLTKK